MMRAALGTAVLLTFSSAAPADTFMVTRTGDSGVGSLRWAINQANQDSGPDQVRFMLRHGVTPVIRPTSPLPRITGDYTAIIGDTDGDGDPDMAINGVLAGAASGLRIEAEGCAIGGLAVTNFEGNGIRLDSANGCLIYSCHLGVNLAGTKPADNGEANIAIRGGGGHRIGGYGRKARNVIGTGHSGAAPVTGGPGILIRSSSHNVVAGNNIGVDRAGMAILADPIGRVGILLDRVIVAAGTLPGPPSSHNTIGGTKPGERNIIAGTQWGIRLESASDSTISGNWLGLASDGNKGLGNRDVSVSLEAGSTNNVVGGTTAGARNVFAGGTGTGSYRGVDIRGAGAEGNKVQGNYFGTNAAGTQWRPTKHCVVVSAHAGAQLIGGRGGRARNHFCPHTAAAVALVGTGSGTAIRRNTFGVLPDGTDSGPYVCGITISGASCKVLNNHIAGASAGLSVYSGAKARAFGNLFRKCKRAVFLRKNSWCLLGNLGNDSTEDDGGNTFRLSNTKYIVNRTPNRIRAEGNVFGSTVQSEIDARIVDKLDNPSYGRVDFIPLKNGVIPTGEAAVASLSVTNAAALPTKAHGAEIAFTLSAPADVSVTVLNIAGRPVATVARDLAAEAGTNRLVWSGQTEHGTRAPAGRYLVRITGRNADGEQHAALCGVALP